MSRFVPNTIQRGEFLRLADEPGCVVCHAAHAAVDRFFAWYRIEQYREPWIIQRMQEARGFCLVHTRQFVGSSSPHLVSTVYLDLLAAAASLLKAAARESSSLPGVLADRIRPQVACVACENEERAVNEIARVLPLVLTDSQVRAAISRPSALCLPHFLHLLLSLDWEVARLLAHAQIASLQAALAEYDTGAEPTEFVRLLVGANADEAFLAQPECASMASPADTQAAPPSALSLSPMEREQKVGQQNAPGAAESGDLPTEQPSWSPAVARMETLLNVPGCPLCREEETTVATYLRWLSQELSERTSSQAVGDARWLCRNHLWRFILIGDDKAVGGLLRSICAYWTGMVQALVSGLDRPPSTSFAARCWHGMIAARRRTPRVSVWHAFWEGVAEGRRSMTKRLAELLEPVVRARPCPACRFQREHAERLANLLNRTLGDPGIARRYEGASGVCVRHLPLAIRRCTEPGNVRFLLWTQYTRVTVLHWELEEYWRKLNWTHRWEPKDDEQTAWCRAVAQYSGSGAIR